ncbi:MAG: hypothetical protein ACLSFC_26885 [Enterocloster bolteae]
MKTKPKKKSIAMLAVPAGICVTALSISVFFLVQITGRMNLSANQNLLTSSKVISEGLHNKLTGAFVYPGRYARIGAESAVGRLCWDINH